LRNHRTCRSVTFDRRRFDVASRTRPLEVCHCQWWSIRRHHWTL